MISKQELTTFRQIVGKPSKDRTTKETATAYVIMLKDRQGKKYKYENIEPLKPNVYK